MGSPLWQKCVDHLESELTPQQFNTWIRPLHAIEEGDSLRLLAPNRFVLEWVNERFISQINSLASSLRNGSATKVTLEIGSKRKPQAVAAEAGATRTSNTGFRRKEDNNRPTSASNLRNEFTFDTFVEGKSNQLARAASIQVAEHPGTAYNPLYIYGGVGLGKTHLMHAVGNLMLKNNPSAQVVYLHSERFVSDMVKALQHNVINEFKRFYRSVDALLIDDIQFFAGKERSQEEFFHTFNALLEGHQQVIMTCDRYPKEVAGLEERLRSRFGWGLTVSIEPAELETRVAILMSKAAQMNVELPDEIAFFGPSPLRSSARDACTGPHGGPVRGRRFPGSDVGSLGQDGAPR